MSAIVADELSSLRAEIQRLREMNAALMDRKAVLEQNFSAAVSDECHRRHIDLLGMTAAYEATIGSLKMDVRRYQWLRNESLMRPIAGPIVCAADRLGELMLQPDSDRHITIDGRQLDAAIDAAMSAA